MPKRSLAAMLLAAFVLILGVVAAGCGDDDDDGGGGSGAAGGQTEEEKPAIKVGLVTDIGQLNDRGFNQLAFEGVKRAKSELGVDYRVIMISKYGVDSLGVCIEPPLAEADCDLGIDAGPTIVEAIQVGDLIAQPRKLENTIDAHQHMVIRNELS